eukprot:CAMPEP_0181247530 /NCGR_PEP_ID=MMETSP1096-20121128/44662_1 /TAXON_ID=156174 ORGANISM="Chrysochromulina ericina, Strain CCMP281" /NCGR_SAMPLE_ID=MMETSP1096 /ASSEMBLY_ACC=CAM_ASM_000453 /LENGTH=156 /DNA_ID=CAMNT_0023344591 /DNA_START=277 /DNA_END=745 /DNA_ORIENTATION=+
MASAEVWQVRPNLAASVGSRSEGSNLARTPLAAPPPPSTATEDCSQRDERALRVDQLRVNVAVAPDRGEALRPATRVQEISGHDEFRLHRVNVMVCAGRKHQNAARPEDEEARARHPVKLVPIHQAAGQRVVQVVCLAVVLRPASDEHLASEALHP